MSDTTDNSSLSHSYHGLGASSNSDHAAVTRAGKPRRISIVTASPDRDSPASMSSSEEPITVGDWVINLVGREVMHGDRQVRLTYREFELLHLFVQQRGRVLSREQLVDRLWSGRGLDSLRTVDIHVSRLRAKLGAPSDTLIETVRQVGYKLRN